MERLNLDKVKIMAAAATLAMFAGTACAHMHHEHNGVYVYGEVNEEFLWARDGHQVASIVANNNYAPGILGVAGAAELNKCVRVGGVAELQFNVNNSKLVSQLDENDPYLRVVYVDRLETFVSDKSLGKLSLGLGYSASWGITNMSYSGTTETSLGQMVSNNAGGMYFWNEAATKAVNTNPSVNTVFQSLNGVGDWTSLNGLQRTDNRLRYDTPTWMGFSAAASLCNLSHSVNNSAFSAITSSAADRREFWDVAARYENKVFCDFRLAAGVAYGYATQDGYNPTYTRGQEVWSGSIAGIHEPTGINVAVALGERRHENTSVPHYKMWYVQVGDRLNLTHYGKTNVAIDYFQGKDALISGDKGKSWGIGVTQDLCKVNSAVYASLREYKYDNVPGVTYHNIFTFAVGMQYKLGAKL